MNLGAVLVVQFDGPSCLPLRVKASLAVHDNVVGLARNKSRLGVRPSNEWTVCAVTSEVEMRVELQVIDCEQGGCRQQQQNKSRTVFFMVTS